MQQSFDERIETLDLSLFAAIDSQLTPHDRSSLLAIQRAVRTRLKKYSYLEIGSHLGGSIQPHLLDDRCTSVYSIDKRPVIQPDARGDACVYPANSTARMMELLRGVDAERAGKIVTFDTDVNGVDAASIETQPHLCFIDGEHTESACYADYQFCRRIMHDQGLIVFHDANIIFHTLRKILTELEAARTPFRAFVLPSVIFVIELEGLQVHTSDAIHGLLQSNYEAYLYGLESMAHYREVYLSRPVQSLRTVKHIVDRLRRFIRI